MKLKKGSKIFYPAHGAGWVKGTKKIEFGGEKKDYWEFDFVNTDLTVSTPIENVDELGIRKVTSKTKLRELLKKVKKRPRRQPKDEEYNKRIEKIKDMAETGEPKNFVRALQQCNYIRNVREKEKRNIPVQLKRMTKKLTAYLIGELAVAEEIELEKAEEKYYKLTGIDND